MKGFLSELATGEWTVTIRPRTPHPATRSGYVEVAACDRRGFVLASTLIATGDAVNTVDRTWGCIPADVPNSRLWVVLDRPSGPGGERASTAVVAAVTQVADAERLWVVASAGMPGDSRYRSTLGEYGFVVRDGKSSLSLTRPPRCLSDAFPSPDATFDGVTIG